MKKNSGLLCRILNDDQEIVLVCKENRIKKITLLMFDHIHQSISDKYQTHICFVQIGSKNTTLIHIQPSYFIYKMITPDRC